MSEEVQCRTKRRYAHELYPQADEYEVRPLEVEVPCLYARAIGLGVFGTGWFSAEAVERMGRTHQMIDARHLALMSDALLQGLTGQVAHEWVEGNRDHEGELFYEAAMKHIPDIGAIKPYPCGPKPDKHDHFGETMANGWQLVTFAPGAEEDCADCTEEVEPTP